VLDLFETLTGCERHYLETGLKANSKFEHSMSKKLNLTKGRSLMAKIKYNMLMRLEQNNIGVRKDQLLQVRLRYWDRDFCEQLVRSFIMLSGRNTLKLKNEEELFVIYLTQKSIRENFVTLFGYECQFLADRFYRLLAFNFKSARIYYPQYLSRLWMLYEGNFMERNQFAFLLMDSDQDGILDARDIQLLFREVIDKKCPEKRIKPINDGEQKEPGAKASAPKVNKDL
jgi:hypothetical protein